MTNTSPARTKAGKTKYRRKQISNGKNKGWTRLTWRQNQAESFLEEHVQLFVGRNQRSHPPQQTATSTDPLRHPPVKDHSLAPANLKQLLTLASKSVDYKGKVRLCLCLCLCALCLCFCGCSVFVFWLWTFSAFRDCSSVEIHRLSFGSWFAFWHSILFSALLDHVLPKLAQHSLNGDISL